MTLDVERCLKQYTKAQIMNKYMTWLKCKIFCKIISLKNTKRSHTGEDTSIFHLEYKKLFQISKKKQTIQITQPPPIHVVTKHEQAFHRLRYMKDQ